MHACTNDTTYTYKYGGPHRKCTYTWQNKQRQQGTIPRGKKKRERERESRRGIGSERERKGERNEGAGYTSSWPIPLENGTGGCVLPPKRSRIIVMGSSPHGSRGVGSKCYGAGKAWLKLRAVARRSTKRQTTRRAHQSPTASLKRFPFSDQGLRTGGNEEETYIWRCAPIREHLVGFFFWPCIPTRC